MNFADRQERLSYALKVLLSDCCPGGESSSPALGAAARIELPSVRCTPWCDQGDGHPGQFGLSDQSCWEPIQYFELSLEGPAEDDYAQKIGVLARRRPREQGHVLIHLDGVKVLSPDEVLDHEMSLTADEAQRLGERLIASAKLARSTPGEDS